LESFKIIVDQQDMTFEEVAASGPNALHDAELQRFEMDYVHRTLRFDLVVWIGDMDDPRRRELYRPARLTLDDVAFPVIGPPDINYPWLKAGPIRIDTESCPAWPGTCDPNAGSPRMARGLRIRQPRAERLTVPTSRQSGSNWLCSGPPPFARLEVLVRGGDSRFGRVLLQPCSV
jgi:hypothetical protein